MSYFSERCLHFASQVCQVFVDLLGGLLMRQRRQHMEVVSSIPFQLRVGAAIFTIVSNKQNESQVQESRALYKHLNIMKG